MSMHRNLEDAICLLALISDRPPGLEESTQRTEPRDIDSELESYPDDEESDDPEDPTVLGADPEHEQYRIQLKNQFLDRLAETLARFKTDAQAKTSNDAKHVSAAMMVCYEDEGRVKILCAKNEGLEQEDEDFLARWKLLMESIARKECASDEDTSAMFNLVADYQWPRITTYLESLKRVFRPNVDPELAKSALKLSLLEERVLAIPSLQIREWEDDNEFLFTIPPDYSTRANRPAPVDELTNLKSNTTCTGETVHEIHRSVSKLFENIRRLCQGDTTPEDEASILKGVMSHMFDLWREPRARFTLKAALRRHFTGQKQRDTLLFLARVCYAAYIYIEIAKVSRYFRSIEIVSVPHSRNQGRHEVQSWDKKTRLHKHGGEHANILDVIKTLGLNFHPSWKGYLAKNAAWFTRLRKSKRDKRFHHAETQLLAHFEYSMSTDDKDQSHKYIGCSKRCCWLCYILVSAHEHFEVRGTHETLLYRWDVPMHSPTGKGGSSTQLKLAMDRLLMQLKVSLESLLNSPQRKHRNLRAQSSHALSSTGAIWQRKPEYHNASYRGFQHLMMMPTAFNNALLIVPIHNKPGYALVSGARFDHGPMEMTLTEAERLKDQDIRSMFELESPNGMPLRGVSLSRKCKSCGQLCGFRCSACRMNYCSRKCQSKDWFRHVFVCCVKNRPNDVDYLKVLTKQWLAEKNDLVSRAHLLKALFRDDDLCKTFGFNVCVREIDVVNLLCLYNNLTCRFSSKRLQQFVEHHTLGGFIEYSIQCQRAQTNSQDCSCFPWFLSLYQSRSFDIPNHDGQYLYQFWAIEKLEKAFSIDYDTVLSRPEHVVWLLYKTLLREFNNLPNIGDPEWIRFGFCYCTSKTQMKLLAKAYIQLATHASLNQIATAWESDTLLDVMVAKGIAISALVSDGIYPRQPSPETIGIYRFMSEVSHGLSGCPSCACKNVRCKFHSKDEPLLFQESEVEYGFHSVNTWERWQLLNFYSDIFTNPKFNPQKMQEARRDSDAHALEKYIESLVPGFHRTMLNEHMTDGMFPKLTSRLKFQGAHPSCECFIHKVPVSEGVEYNVKIEIDWLREQYDERNRELAPGS